MTGPIENHDEDIVEEKAKNKEIAKEGAKPPEIKEKTKSLLPNNLDKKGTGKNTPSELKKDQLNKKEQERIEFEKYRKRREALDNEFELRSLAKRRTGSHLSLIIGGILFLASFAAVLIFLNVVSSQ